MRRIAALTVALLAASPAAANWQWTEWGMSPADVLAMPDVREPTPNETDTLRHEGHGPILAAAPYTAGSIETVALFYFEDSQRLSAVVLSFDDRATFYEAQRTLRAQYGTPTSHELRTSPCYDEREMWRAPDVGNELNLQALDCNLNDRAPVFMLTYTPLPVAGSSGF